MAVPAGGPAVGSGFSAAPTVSALRICLVTPEFLPTWGGVGSYAFQLARGLRDADDVHVLTARVDDAWVAAMPRVTLHGAFSGAAPSEGVSPLWFQIAVSRVLPRLERENAFDIVHVNHAYMSDLLTQSRTNGGRRVLTVHTTLETQSQGTLLAGKDAPRQPIEKQVLRWRPILRRIERRYLRRRYAMIFVSKWVRDRALQTYDVQPDVSAVVPNGIDASMFSPLPDTNSTTDDEQAPVRTVLFAGRLLAMKGITTLLRAIALINPSVRCRIAGPGDQSGWRAYARTLGLGPDRAEFVGPVSYPEMPDLYRAADVVVLPSFTESCPMVALEAMAAGVPLIATDAGGIPEIVRDGETGWLFPPGVPERLAELITRVLAEPDSAAAVAHRARAWVTQHASVQSMVEETHRFYAQALGEAS